MSVAGAVTVRPKQRAERLQGREAATLARTFPPRPRKTSWPATASSYDEVVDRLRRPPFTAEHTSTQGVRLVGARHLLRWLGSLPGTTWQERWETSPAATAHQGWTEVPRAWCIAAGYKPKTSTLASGMLALIGADVLRPSMTWLCGNHSQHLRPAIAASRDPEGFAKLAAWVPPGDVSDRAAQEGLQAVARILAAHGGRVEDIVVGDLLALKAAYVRTGPVRYAYAMLRGIGTFPADAPVTLTFIGQRSGPLTPAELVDRYRLRCRPVRDLLVAYLGERQPRLDFVTVKSLSTILADLFWGDLERHHLGIDSLRLSAEIRDGWKARISVKTVRFRGPDGVVTEVIKPRANAANVMMAVRAFYLDIAQWALDEPERWGAWALPSPISEADCSSRQAEQAQKARSDRRTRERLPVLAVLVATAHRRLQETTARLAAVDAAQPGSTVTVLGETFTLPKRVRAHGRPGVVYDSRGRHRHLRRDEKRAFFAWAAIEILRHTGIRIEELGEIGHHSIISYRLPSTGEVVPLLQIAPSKTDQERLLLINPELADVLAVMIRRVRQPDGAVPAIAVYDGYERVWNAPMPVLFQEPIGGESRHVGAGLIRNALNETLRDSGLLDATGQPLEFQPHDFRRIFITDAILNGLPPHIAQVIAGHQSLNSTMGYAAIYPSDAIEAHRAYIARRRALRPSEEYRTITPEEWQEFLSHFEHRKLALGECGRAYGTDCAHEHACVRCPVLVVGPAERPRLTEIRDNLTARIAEAEQQGWLGEVEGLTVSLNAAHDKIEQLDAQQARRVAPVFLGLPSLAEFTARSGNAGTSS